MLFSTSEVGKLGADPTRLLEMVRLRAPEGPHVEYKKQLPGSNEEKEKYAFLRTVSGFANASGGTFFVGVEEPAEGLQAEDQIVGIADGEALAQALERLARTAIDPRIPGLLVLPVKLDGGLRVVVAQVPASAAKPHMVTLKKKRDFFIRHSESTTQMTMNEIRQAVLFTANAAQMAEERLERYAAETMEFDRHQRDALFVQATPLAPPHSGLDLVGREARGKIRDLASHGLLKTDYAARPTMNGVRLFADRALERNRWIVDVHRTGYVSMIFFDHFIPVGEGTAVKLSTDHCSRFGAFCGLLDRLLAWAQYDSPYVVRCRYLSAEDCVLHIKNEGDYGPYGQPEIRWPDLPREPGVSFLETLPVLFCERLFNAFGQERPAWPG